MIIVRAPLRITLAGGGTDIKEYYSKYGSLFITATISKYIYITYFNTPFTKKIRMKYAITEEVDSINEIKNEIIRETFRLHEITNNVEVASHADIPSGTGLGSSGTFGVGLLHALYANSHSLVTKQQIAEEATYIQKDIIGFPIGKNDQYSSTFGGTNIYCINKEGDVTVTPLNITELKKYLVLFFTGYSRNANKILFVQKDKVKELQTMHQLSYAIKNSLEEKNYSEFGKLMNQHWEYKKSIAPEMTNPQIDSWYNKALNYGAIGGKLIGAGGGGFLLFYTHDPDELIKKMTEEGLQHLPFQFEPEGSKVLINE